MDHDNISNHNRDEILSKGYLSTTGKRLLFNKNHLIPDAILGTLPEELQAMEEETKLAAERVFEEVAMLIEKQERKLQEGSRSRTCEITHNGAEMTSNVQELDLGSQKKLPHAAEVQTEPEGGQYWKYSTVCHSESSQPEKVAMAWREVEIKNYFDKASANVETYKEVQGPNNPRRKLQSELRAYPNPKHNYSCRCSACKRVPYIGMLDEPRKMSRIEKVFDTVKIRQQNNWYSRKLRNRYEV